MRIATVLGAGLLLVCLSTSRTNAGAINSAALPAPPTTTTTPDTDAGDVVTVDDDPGAETTTIAALIAATVASSTVAISRADEPPARLANHTCYQKQISWSIPELEHLRKCSTVAGSVVMTFLDENDATDKFGTSVMDYSFPDLMYV